MLVKSICIVGGGTSGWLTACYLKHNLPHIKITLIESTKIGTIGVGEGTQPYTTKFLRDCGLEPKDWMQSSDATYKLGVEFIGWQRIPFFVDNDSTITHIVAPGKLIHKYWIGKDPKSYYDWLPAYRLAKANISPKFQHDLDFVIGSASSPSEAVHFNAAKIVSTLKNKVKNSVRYIDGEITLVEVDDNGISSLKIEELKILADLYIDCTGFKSLLLEKSLGVQHNYIDELLPCNKAIAIPTNYKDPLTECHPYTKATAMTNGWRWTIPTFGRIGNGYVYSSDFIDTDSAELEFRKSINDFTTEALHLNMKTGYKKQICFKNVMAVGLSGGFVEPLEATGITFTTKSVEMLVSYLKSFDFQYNNSLKESINELYLNLFREIVTFIHLHYRTNSKQDTDFWKSFEHCTLPEFSKEILQSFVLEPPDKLFDSRLYNMFHSGQWFQVLNACGQYLGEPNSLVNHTYYEIHEKILSLRTDLEIKHFPNHYRYLEHFYNCSTDSIS